MSNWKLALNKRQWLVAILLILLTATVLVWTGLSRASKNRLITESKISINKEKQSYFLSVSSVGQLLTKEIGNPTGLNAANVNTMALEAKLKQNPFIKKAEVFIGLDGILNVKIEEREPVILIYNKYGESYFLDTQGIMIPNQHIKLPTVVIANGNIIERLRPGKPVQQFLSKEMVKLGGFIAADSLWSAQFQQLYVDNYNEFLLIPRVGKHSIVVGDASELAEKFANLRLFYDEGFKVAGWDKYEQIDISIRNQVVGRTSVQQTEQSTENGVH